MRTIVLATHAYIEALALSTAAIRTKMANRLSLACSNFAVLPRRAAPELYEEFNLESIGIASTISLDRQDAQCFAIRHEMPHRKCCTHDHR